MLKTSKFRLLKLISFLRSHLLCQYKVLLDIVAYDTEIKNYRFALIYNLLSKVFNSRLFLCLYTDQAAQVQSVSLVYSSANWLEREV
jgi:NADH:ubiquinone oxidoreductase subunit C